MFLGQVQMSVLLSRNKNTMTYHVIILPANMSKYVNIDISRYYIGKYINIDIARDHITSKRE